MRTLAHSLLCNCMVVTVDELCLWPSLCCVQLNTMEYSSRGILGFSEYRIKTGAWHLISPYEMPIGWTENSSTELRWSLPSTTPVNFEGSKLLYFFSNLLIFVCFICLQYLGLKEKRETFFLSLVFYRLPAWDGWSEKAILFAFPNATDLSPQLWW